MREIKLNGGLEGYPFFQKERIPYPKKRYTDIPAITSRFSKRQVPYMKGFTSVLSLIFVIAIAVTAVYTYGVAVGVNEAVVKKISIEKDIYLLGNSLKYSKLFLDTTIKYATYQSLSDYGSSQEYWDSTPTVEDFKNQILENHALAIKDGKILAIIPSDKAKEKYQAAAQENYATHAVMPGFINSHTHISMNVFRKLKKVLITIN